MSDREIQRKAYSAQSRESGVSSTRETRELMAAQFGGQFSSKFAKEYEKLTPEQRSDMEGMTENEAKRELREARRKREKLEETMRNTEPAWKGDPVKEKPAPKIKGDGVIDVGREDVLIGGRGSNDAGMTNEPDSNSGDIPDGTEWREFSICGGGTITVLCKTT